MDSWMMQDPMRPNEELVKIRTRHAHNRADLVAYRRAERAARPQRSFTAALRLRL